MNKSVGEMLYDQGKTLIQKNEMIRMENEQVIQRMANSKHTQKTTEQMVEHRKSKKFSEVFSMLDSDQDGLISATKIDISSLTPDLLQIFTPLLCEMEELGQTLD